MRLSPLRKWSARIDVRVGLAFCGLFVAGAFCLFLVVYALFSRSLTRRDHELIEIKTREYTALYEREGVAGLKRIASEVKMRDQGAEFFVRLANNAGQTLYIHTPVDFRPFDLREVEGSLLDLPPQPGWTNVQAKQDEDALEILTSKLADGIALQVGLSTDDREDTLERLQQIFTITLGISFLLSALMGWLLSKRILRPVRELIKAIRTIRAGDFKARVPRLLTDDEIDNLIRLFNDLLEHIESLITGMRDSLDIVAHDIRTPMTRLRVASEMALREGTPLAIKDRAIGECLESSDEVLSLLDSLLDISEAEAGAMKLHYEPIQALQLLREVRDLYEIVAEEKKVRIEICVNAEMVFEADRQRMKRVFANLVDNALKYIGGGSLVKLTAHDQGSTVVFEIADDGPGIGATDLENLWRRFYRGAASHQTPGFGLGLSLVSSIVKGHGGGVAAESHPGRGARFIVRLPKHRSSLTP